MAGHPELQAKAERERWAGQEEEQAAFSPGITHARTSGDGRDATVTFRRPDPDEHRLSEGNLSRIERERYARRNLG